MAQTIITLPYAWIVKGNSVSLIIAILTVIGGIIPVGIRIWKIGPDGFWQVVATVIMTALLIEVVIGTIMALLNLHSAED